MEGGRERERECQPLVEEREMKGREDNKVF